MKLTLAFIVGLATAAVALQQKTTVASTSKTMVNSNDRLSLSAGDRFVCAVNPSAFTPAENTPALVDYTVPGGKSFSGIAMFSGTEK